MGNAIPALSEEAIALSAVHKFGADWLYAPDLDRWHAWDGNLWRSDEKKAIFTLAREQCREFSALAAKDKATESIARALASAHTRAAVVSLMANDPRLVVLAAELDANPWLLGTPGGVVDLRTGELLSANRQHRITLSTAVSPAPAGTSCPLWRGFLETTFPLVPGKPEPDEEVIGYVQRLSGYSLTGLTREEKFAYLYGSGRNGKGTVVETFANIMGDYATMLPSEALMERPVEPHRAELAMLRGKRLVVSNEIPSGKRWNQARLMELTGGGELTANEMRRNPTKFRFQGKLWIAGNEKPKFPSVNIAVRARLMLLAFHMHFLNSDQNPELRNDPRVAVCKEGLKAELQAEGPAILRWMIDGCLAWQEKGLQIPKTVIRDGGDYLGEQDEFGQWLLDACMVDLASSAGGAMRELFFSWNLWRLERNEKPTTYPEFRERVKERFNVTHANFGAKAIGLFLTDIERARVLRAKEERRYNTDSEGRSA